MVRESVTPYVFRDSPSNGSGFYVKTAEKGFAVGDINTTYQSYLLLKDLFRVPRFKLLNSRDNPLLVTAEVPGENLSILMKSNPEQAVEMFDLYKSDLISSWKKTAVPMDETQLVRDMRKESLATLEAVEANTEYQRIAKQKLFINNERYLSAAEILADVKDNLISHRDPIMVTAHGDEHFGNIISDGKNYGLIDPRISGNFSPAQSVNSLVGANYLVFYDYQSEVIDDEIHFSIKNKAEPMFKKKFQELKAELDKLSNKLSLVNEYLFSNLIRGFIGRVNEKNKERIQTNKYAYLAVAVQAAMGEII